MAVRLSPSEKRILGLADKWLTIRHLAMEGLEDATEEERTLFQSTTYTLLIEIRGMFPELKVEPLAKLCSIRLSAGPEPWETLLWVEDTVALLEVVWDEIHNPERTPQWLQVSALVLARADLGVGRDDLESMAGRAREKTEHFKDADVKDGKLWVLPATKEVEAKLLDQKSAANKNKSRSKKSK